MLGEGALGCTNTLLGVGFLNMELIDLNKFPTIGSTQIQRYEDLSLEVHEHVYIPVHCHLYVYIVLKCLFCKDPIYPIPINLKRNVSTKKLHPNGSSSYPDAFY